MTYETLQIEMHDQVVVLTVARPEKLNALDHRTIGELHRAFEAFAGDDSIRAVVVTGAGEKAFVAGADIAEIREQTPLDARRFSERGQQLMRRIETMTKPVIAAINGYCLGGGLELALACHVRYASENARLGLPEIKLGILPGFGGTQRLSRLIGRGRALEMILTGEPVDAHTAEGYGIVQGVVDAGELAEHALGVARRLAAAAPHAVGAILETTDKGLDMPLEQGLAFETARFALCCATEDMREGTAAFLEKRKPQFRGR
ncbi:MAG: enoyl-CoA hydratase [Xanthomonadales bacterium]|nr:enoyl-CoA hydratase [Xanthomonadales bacterium]|tara:strand:+ start:587 stop:1369 length:783 start_codon:yes stop_codon:yes gene_type:complete